MVVAAFCKALLPRPTDWIHRSPHTEQQLGILQPVALLLPCHSGRLRLCTCEAASGLEDAAVDLTLWIPATLGLGLIFLALMVLFVEACDRV